MSDLVLIFFTILCVALIFVLYRQNLLLKHKKDLTKAQISTDITKLRSIGELCVFQVYSKEIVTKKAGVVESGFWKSMFNSFFSSKQIAIIFEFEVNFIYDLRSSEFEIIDNTNGKFFIKMPPCKFKHSIKDIKIYDEKNAKFLPFLLPDAFNGIIGVSFDEADKNRLITQAKDEVNILSLRMIDELEGKIHKSAKDTLETIAMSFGAKEVEFEFNETKFITNSLKEIKLN